MIDITKMTEHEIELLRQSAWDDLYIFSKYVCGRDLMREQPHREICEVLTYGLETSEQLNLQFVPPMSMGAWHGEVNKLKKLLLIPRGTFKSTIATNALPLWLMWHNQDLRIMIDSETLGNAKMYLAGIKDMIENNITLKIICSDARGYALEPNYKIAGGWTEDQIILKRREKRGLKEPTIFCSGVDNARTGMHPDVILMDDLVSERNVGTKEQIEKVKDHYKFSLSLLEPDGLQIIIGTRYHMADLYGELIDAGTFDVYERPAILNKGTEEERLFFPDRLTYNFLEALRKEQGSYIFNCQYMLHPISEDNAVFKADDIQYYDFVPNFMQLFITIDLAISESKRADYTVIMVTGITPDKKWYVVEYIQEKMKPKKFLEELFHMVRKYQKKLTMVGIETVGFQKVMMHLIKDEMRRSGTFFKIKELKADRDKIRRVGSLQPIFEGHNVLIHKHHKELELELLEFPYSRHDDLVDALAYVMQMVKIGKYTYRQQQEANSYKPANSITGY